MPTINAWDSNIPVEISKGGTNATSFSTSNGIVKYDGTRLVSSSTEILPSNIWIKTGQPAFSAYKSSTTNNVTGDGTQYAFICDTEIFDIGTNYNATTGVFTAPVTGVYLFTTNVLVNNCTIANYIVLNIQATESYQRQYGRTASAGDFGVGFSVIIFMNSADTAFPLVRVTGEAAKTNSVAGSATGNATFFQGCLLF
jgi:hypothetical protein